MAGTVGTVSGYLCVGYHSMHVFKCLEKIQDCWSSWLALITCSPAPPLQRHYPISRDTHHFPIILLCSMHHQLVIQTKFIFQFYGSLNDTMRATSNEKIFFAGIPIIAPFLSRMFLDQKVVASVFLSLLWSLITSNILYFREEVLFV